MSPLTQEEIQRLTDPRSFERGWRYFQQGAILSPLRWENQLYALCQGSAPDPYQVRLTLDDEGHITDYECTCPRRGFCKHVVALALTWVHKPQDFHVIPPLEQALAHHQREDLLALIRQMVKRHPDLLLLLESETLAQEAEEESEATVILSHLRGYLSHLLYAPDPQELEEALERTFQVAKRQAAAGNWLLAGEVYALVLRETLQKALPVWESDEELLDIFFTALADAAQLLRDLLEQHAEQIPPQRKRDWYEALFELWMYDIEQGGYGLSVHVADALLHAPEDVWAWIEEQVRRRLDAATSWFRETMVDFLAQRREIEGRPEAAARIILTLGTPTQQAFLLVKQGRLDEARRIATEHFGRYPGLAQRFAETLTEAGHPEEALNFWRDLSRQNASYLPSLAEALESQGQWAEALTIWKDLLAQKPSRETYRHLKRAAQKLGCWDEERPPLERILTWPIHVALEVLLEEGELETALRLFWRQVHQEQAPGWFWTFNRVTWAERLAQATEQTHPEEALTLYRALAEWAIARRGRENYRDAVAYLKKVRALYRRLGQGDAWKVYIAHLRQTYRRLRALQDELTKAGL